MKGIGNRDKGKEESGERWLRKEKGKEKRCWEGRGISNEEGKVKESTCLGLV